MIDFSLMHKHINAPQRMAYLSEKSTVSKIHNQNLPKNRQLQFEMDNLLILMCLNYTNVFKLLSLTSSRGSSVS